MTTAEHILRIQRDVANHFNMLPSALVGRDRSDYTALARHIAIHLASQLTDATSTTIGKLFQRDHSTVLHARKVVLDRMATETAVREHVERLMILCRA